MIDNRTLVNIVTGLIEGKKIVYSSKYEGIKDNILKIKPKVSLDLPTIATIYWEGLSDQYQKIALKKFLETIDIYSCFLSSVFERSNTSGWDFEAHVVKEVNSSFMEIWNPIFQDKDGNELHVFERLRNGKYTNDRYVYGFELISVNKVKVYKKSLDSNLEENEFYEDAFIVFPVINKKIIQFDKIYLM